MPEESPRPISMKEERARQARVNAVARRLGFAGSVEYRHVSTRSGGAQYGKGATALEDLFVVYPEAFRRDLDPGDFSLEAIIAHERGHQLICRDNRLRRNMARDMSDVTEEVLASFVRSIIIDDAGAGENLVLKALFVLVERGMRAEEASRRVEDVLMYLEAVL
jgi:hypothetical protein